LCVGVISSDLQLADETVLGEWKIVVKAGVSCTFLAVIDGLHLLLNCIVIIIIIIIKII